MKRNQWWATALPLLSSLVGAATLCLAPPARAGELYGSTGVPILTVGYAEALGDRAAVRVEVGTMHVSASGAEKGVVYDVHGDMDRVSALADWFPLDGHAFRLTGGLSWLDARVRVDGQGSNEIVFLGGQPYLLTPLDRFQTTGRYPSVSPYLGLGWGHQANPSSGWGLLVDVGVSVARASVSGQAYGPVLSTPDAQRDFRAELDKWQGRANRAPVLPQLSIGVSKAF